MWHFLKLSQIDSKSADYAALRRSLRYSTLRLSAPSADISIRKRNATLKCKQLKRRKIVKILWLKKL